MSRSTLRRSQLVTPASDERMISGAAKSDADRRGAVEVDGQMVDEATNKMATEIVERATAACVL